MIVARTPARVMLRLRILLIILRVLIGPNRFLDFQVGIVIFKVEFQDKQGEREGTISE